MAPLESITRALTSRGGSTAIDNLILSLLGVSGIAALLVWWEPGCRHWFVVPLLLCGTVIGADAVAWVRGQCDVLDPVGLLGLLGVHFFFLVPLLHVTWNLWMPYVVPPSDWREWLGAMAFLNFFGLTVYRWSRSLIPSCKHAKSVTRQYRLDGKVFPFVLVGGLIASGLLQIFVYHLYGGISGYVNRYVNSLSHYGSTDPDIGFVGMGWLFTLSESFTILAAIGFVVLANGKRWVRNPLVLSLVLVCFFVIQIFFGGLRGSRSNILWGLFWLVALIHFYIRPLSKRLICVGLIGLVGFMYFYTFYKFLGSTGFQVFEDSAARVNLESKTGWKIHTVLLTDLGRSDIQSFALYKLMSEPSDYEYAYGRTYLGAFAILVPHSVWPERPPAKVRWTTELEYGKGSYNQGALQSSRVYGLAGEAMLNFGPLAVPFVFALFGFIVGWVRRLGQELNHNDSRRLLLPLLVLLCILLLVNDSENNVFFLVKYGAMPALVVGLGSMRVHTRQFLTISRGATMASLYRVYKDSREKTYELSYGPSTARKVTDPGMDRFWRPRG